MSDATPYGHLITVPERAREEIGELAFYLEQALRNLHEVNEHVRGSSSTMPGVLHELRDIVKMTEAATLRVLEETEALVDNARKAACLITALRDFATAGRADEAGAPLIELETLVDDASTRAMAIMSALEFQDLTAQKVHRTFGVLEEVVSRLAKIQTLVDHDRPPVVAPPAEAGGKSGQDLADELALHFAR
jgi:chemotaxis regulatin CheY-phosphate phosphatase CheZ